MFSYFINKTEKNLIDILKVFHSFIELFKTLIIEEKRGRLYLSKKFVVHAYNKLIQIVICTSGVFNTQSLCTPLLNLRV